MSLSVRLFALGAVIALVAVVAATWATVRATTVAVHEEQQESLHADAQTYDALVGYAATHRSWTGAEALVARLARQHDGPVTVTDTTGRVLVGDTHDTFDPTQARARIDPLDVDTTLLAPLEVDQAPQDAGPVPGTAFLVAPTLALDSRVSTLSGPGAVTAFRGIGPAVDACLARTGLGPTSLVTRDLSVFVSYPDHHRRVARCLDESLRAAFTPYVAPPALVFVSGEGSRAEVFWDLSGHNQRRILLLAGGVLLVTLLLSALLAATIVVPLRRLSAAALRAADGDLTARVPEGRRDELGRVARAFNRMAERRQQLEDARRQMVSDVSHELRTPLANVRGWVEAARDGVVEPDQELVASLLEESLHLQRLVDDLHDLALGDAGELRLDPQPVELRVFLEQVAASFRAAAQRAGLGVEVDCPPTARLVADPVRLRQAVTNLVANALRHTPSGGRVTLRGADGTVTVEDTGEGIPAADLPHVFDRFRRVDPSRSRATGGSGLGLAIVRQLVEAHGGTASASSEVGRGTAVVLAFPTGPTQPAATPGRPGTGRPASWRTSGRSS
ncbi:HAMP domain-containing histidine kinase [Nocardioides anomalus]|uniref:histidine kinase n=1 Tax=Nocardioides anomalus TaxID=2712223 RepID=A0A6G6W8Q4_9ACTN|nr:HAMP domain-containing sensor histidine kinase [Nocardioides anomalus]QIG41589.1 HAMP domain-containing histidine kinase [Nocardioides anomalus]